MMIGRSQFVNDAFSFKELGKIVIDIFSAIVCADSPQGVLRVLSLEHKIEVLDSFCGVRLFLQKVDPGGT